MSINMHQNNQQPSGYEDNDGFDFLDLGADILFPTNTNANTNFNPNTNFNQPQPNYPPEQSNSWQALQVDQAFLTPPPYSQQPNQPMTNALYPSPNTSNNNNINDYSQQPKKRKKQVEVNNAHNQPLQGVPPPSIMFGSEFINTPGAGEISIQFLQDDTPHPSLATPPDPNYTHLIQESTKALINCEQNIKRIEGRLEEIKLEQQRLTFPCTNVDALENIHNSQQELKNIIEAEITILNRILHKVILDPKRLSLLFRSKRTLEILQTHLNLFMAELVAIAKNEEDSRCFALLLITQQPFPKSLKQNTKSTAALEETTEIRLLRAPKASLAPTGPVKTSLTFEDYQTTRKSFAVQNNQHPLDDNKVEFADMRFPTGTRQKPVRLQFGLEVQYCTLRGEKLRGALESNPSQPFVVITNENQWEASEALLLKKNAFEGQNAVPWERFANILQLHYLRATRQDVTEPNRPLSKQDIEYIHNRKFDNKEMITTKEFDAFWNWFGRVVHKIRHQKHCYHLWMNGLIFGFVSKAKAEYYLGKEKPGSFIVRFSEQCPGKVAVAYVKAHNEVAHHMLEDDKTKSLPDLLHEKLALTWILKINTEFNPVHLLKNTVLKESVLSNWITRRMWKPPPGYQKDI